MPRWFEVEAGSADVGISPPSCDRQSS